MPVAKCKGAWLDVGVMAVNTPSVLVSIPWLWCIRFEK